jgi:PadR family transcriptional regulator, regulatory protein AphA
MSLEHAILASLDFQPMTGYDLKKFFDLSVGNFWSTTQSHIYKALNDLENQGWAHKHTIPQEDKPNRKEYSITEAGRLELRRWLTTPLPPTPVREAWLIQLFFSHNSSNAEISALLEARLSDIRQILESDYAQAASGMPPEAPPGMQRAYALWQTTADYGRAFYEFELHWHLEMLARVNSLPPLHK